jgi:hypothetical protein
MSKVEHEIENEGGLQRTLKDLFAGAVGGVAQVLLGTWVLSLLFCVASGGGASMALGRVGRCVECIC